VLDAPARELERERREIRGQDLGRRDRREAALRRVAPCAIADAGRGASGAALALLGGRARHALRLEAAHTGRRIEDAYADQPGVDDDADVLDRQARLRD